MALLHAPRAFGAGSRTGNLMCALLGHRWSPVRLTIASTQHLSCLRCGCVGRVEAPPQPTSSHITIHLVGDNRP